MAHVSDLIAEDIELYLKTHENKSLLRFITCGSVDDGKSTLIGRLLYESKMLFEDQLAQLEVDSKKVGTQAGDLDFAAEITRQLKSESYLSPEIDMLDTQIASSIRTISLTQLIETARRRFQESEYVLALQKVQEILNLDPQHTEANTLKVAIEGKRGSAAT